MPDIIQRTKLRRGTAAAWTASNPVLLAGEEGYETDTRLRKVGDGVTVWTGLAYDVASGGGGSVGASTEVASGIVELATAAEVQTGTDTTRVVTPATLTARTASDTRTGIIELATSAETTAGVDTVRAVTPANLAVELAKRALSSHNHTAAQVSDLTEAVQDIVGAMVVAGTNVTVSYDDVTGQVTINSLGGAGGSTDAEVVRDTIAGALVAGTGIQITVDDALNSITIASTSVPVTRQILAGNGLTGGGALSADVQLAVNAATQVNSGIIEIASNTEATTGTDAVRAITPASLKVETNSAKARANHTGTQLAATISDLPEAVQDIVATELVAGENMVLTYDDTAGTILLNAASGGLSSINYTDVPPGSRFTVKKSAGVWPARPSSRADLSFVWKGADPDPAIVVPPSVAGAYDDSGTQLGDSREVTP